MDGKVQPQCDMKLWNCVRWHWIYQHKATWIRMKEIVVEALRYVFVVIFGDVRTSYRVHDRFTIGVKVQTTPTAATITWICKQSILAVIIDEDGVIDLPESINEVERARQNHVPLAGLISFAFSTDYLRWIIIQDLQLGDIMALKHASSLVLLAGTKMRLSTLREYRTAEVRFWMATMAHFDRSLFKDNNGRFAATKKQWNTVQQCIETIRFLHGMLGIPMFTVVWVSSGTWQCCRPETSVATLVIFSIRHW